MAASIDISGEGLSEARVNGVCEALLGSQLRMLSLRNCAMNEKSFKKMLVCVANSKTILQLALCVGVVKDLARVKILALALQKNRSLVSLLVNGNQFGDDGMEMLVTALTQHPHIVSLDVGDCNLGDNSLDILCDLLPTNGAKPGLSDLTLSANSLISPGAWARFALALAVSSNLRELYVDYNRLGDYATSCLLVGLTSNRQIEVMDLESTGITDHTAMLLLHLVENYPVKLRRVVLAENRIHEALVAEIQDSLGDDANSDIQSLASSELFITDQSQPDSTIPITKPEVRVHHVEPAGTTNKSARKMKKNRNNTTISTLGGTDNSDLKDDTVATDEDYRVLAKALEAGLKTGEQNVLARSGQGQMYDSESEEELTEVPIRGTINRRVVQVTNVQKTDWNSLGELMDADSDEGDIIK